jgi:dTDP-glucose 4,6-dehydratase
MEKTYGLPYATNCSIIMDLFISEKLIPYLLIISYKINLYLFMEWYTRDWLFVEDHAVAIDLVFTKV